MNLTLRGFLLFLASFCAVCSLIHTLLLLKLETHSTLCITCLKNLIIPGILMTLLMSTFKLFFWASIVNFLEFLHFTQHVQINAIAEVCFRITILWTPCVRPNSFCLSRKKWRWMQTECKYAWELHFPRKEGLSRYGLFLVLFVRSSSKESFWVLLSRS